MVLPQKKTFNYVEANQKKREQYLEEIKDINPDDIIYSDEAGVDDNEVPPKGWGPIGKRLFAKKRGIRKARYNITASLNKNNLFAPFVFEGYSNASTYETYIEQVLVPQLRPGMVFIIDNARFHKSKKVVQLIKAAQCRIIFLPPYSPDLNPIEHHWAAIKAKIRKAAEAIHDFYEATVKTLGEMCATY